MIFICLLEGNSKFQIEINLIPILHLVRNAQDYIEIDIAFEVI